MHILVKKIIFHVSGIDLEFERIKYMTENENAGSGGPKPENV